MYDKPRLEVDVWVCNIFPRSTKIVKIAKTIEFDRNGINHLFLLDMTKISYYHKRKWSKNRKKNQSCSPFSGLSKPTRIISIAFILSEKNAKLHRNLAGSINRYSKVKAKIHKNHPNCKIFIASQLYKCVCFWTFLFEKSALIVILFVLLLNW